MNGAFDWMRSSVGQKALMAASGLLLFGFVFAHMTGNLKAFQGASSFNHYAEFLREVGSPLVPRGALLWVSRLVLLGTALLHGVLAYRLTKASRVARPQRYKLRPDLGFSYASRTMRWGGVIVAAFIVYHLLHLTVGVVHGDFVRADPYHNLVTGLANPFVALSYVVAVTALALHLFHGLWSASQTLGLAQGRFDGLRRPIATALTAAVWLGYVALPVAVQLGILQP